MILSRTVWLLWFLTYSDAGQFNLTNRKSPEAEGVLTPKELEAVKEEQHEKDIMELRFRISSIKKEINKRGTRLPVIPFFLLLAATPCVALVAYHFVVHKYYYRSITKAKNSGTTSEKGGVSPAGVFKSKSNSKASKRSSKVWSTHDENLEDGKVPLDEEAEDTSVSLSAKFQGVPKGSVETIAREKKSLQKPENQKRRGAANSQRKIKALAESQSSSDLETLSKEKHLRNASIQEHNTQSMVPLPSSRLLMAKSQEQSAAQYSGSKQLRSRKTPRSRTTPKIRQTDMFSSKTGTRGEETTHSVEPNLTAQQSALALVPYKTNPMSVESLQETPRYSTPKTPVSLIKAKIEEQEVTKQGAQGLKRTSSNSNPSSASSIVSRKSSSRSQADRTRQKKGGKSPRAPSRGRPSTSARIVSGGNAKKT